MPVPDIMQPSCRDLGVVGCTSACAGPAGEGCMLRCRYPLWSSATGLASEKFKLWDILEDSARHITLLQCEHGRKMDAVSPKKAWQICCSHMHEVMKGCHF